jgi:signal transduction histidine kinase
MDLDDDFFARIGHDLRGELATMLAGVHYLLRYEKRLEPGPREMLERVRGAGDRLRRLLDEFDHAIWLRVDGERPMQIAACDAVDLVRRVAERLEEGAAARGVRLLVDDTVGEGVAMLDGDVELLAVALDYVIGFAITRSRGRPVRIRVELRGGAPVAVVSDEAGAASPEVIARLLEPFVERTAIAPDPVAPRRRERLGLGLAIARGIFAAHGGDLVAAPESGGAGDGDLDCAREPSSEPGEGEAVQSERRAAGLRLTCTLGGAVRGDGDKLP